MTGPFAENAPEHRKRVLSGMRPTGRLHIGHYFGALQNWVKLQNDPQYECFFFIADWHAMTSDYADTSQVAQNSIEIATDWLAAGLDPERCTMFLQSSVPEHAELHLLLSMIAPLGWLERVPTYKEALDNIVDKDLHTYGFLGYPVLQSADIVMYDADLVPVGEDQVVHVELTREIVRRFNFFYGLNVSEDLFAPNQRKNLAALLDRIGWPDGSSGPHGTEDVPRAAVEALVRKKAEESGLTNFLGSIGDLSRLVALKEVLREPEAMLTLTPRIPGTDGRKMSKSYGNSIALSESDDSIRAKTRVMMTDPARKRRTDPGNPDVCPVFDWHKLFSPRETLQWASEGCVTAGIGCIECKSKMADHLIKWIEPVRQRRQDYEQQPQHVLDILDTGSKRARLVAQSTMEGAREAVFGWQKTRKNPALVSTASNMKAGK